MHPEINLSEFKATATTDWLDIAVTLGRTTQFQYVQTELHSLLGLSPVEAVIYVTAQNVAKDTDAATCFVLRLQEHHHENNAAKIAHVVRGLATRFGFAAPARITGIEISFDLKPKKDPYMVYEAYAFLHSQLAAYGKGGRQYTTINISIDPIDELPPKTPFMVDLSPDIPFDPYGSLYVGHQDDQYGHQPTAIAYRSYAKVTDNNQQPIPPSEHRARAEVTLQMEALEEYGLTDPLTLASYDFTKVARLLHFQTFKTPSEIYADHLAQIEKDLRAAVEARRKTGRRPPEEFLSRMRSRVAYRKYVASGLANLARSTDRVIDWQRRVTGSDDQELKHSKDTTPNAKLNRKVKNALLALSKKMATSTYKLR